MLADLDGIECTNPYARTDKRKTAADRCEAWACPDYGPHYDDKHTRASCIEKYVTNESAEIPQRQLLAHAMCNAFNKTYSKGVNVYRYIGQSSAYMRYQDLDAILNGEGVPLKQVLVKEDPSNVVHTETLLSHFKVPDDPNVSWRKAQARQAHQMQANVLSRGVR
jgi:hypothetical protein